MEPLAASLNIPVNSGVYTYAVDLYHQLQPRLNSQKFTSRCTMAACLHLSSTHHSLSLSPTLAAKKAGITTKTLTSCLELAASTHNLVTAERVAKSLGYQAIGEVAEEIVKRSGRNGSVIVAAAVYLACQAVGLRVGLAGICGEAYANQQHVQRCSLEIRNGSVKEYLDKIEEDEELVKRIKSEGKQQVKKRKVEQVVSRAPLQEKRPETRKEKSFMQSHYTFTLGFAPFTTSPLDL